MLDHPKSIKYRNNITTKIKFWLFSFTKFPALNFFGIKLRSLDPKECVVTVKYARRNSNPFGSIYFAALNGAAELPTGILLQYYLQAKGSVSMLVGEAHSKYMKKAVGTITFTCDQGDEIATALESLQNKGDHTSFDLIARGMDETGVEVMNQTVTWFVKLRD